MSRKRIYKSKTENIIPRRDKNGNKTCYDYFKIKKPKSSRSKLGQTDASDKTCPLVIKEQLQNSELVHDRPKRLRHDSLKQCNVKNQATSVLSIEDVQTIVAAQKSYDGGVNCNVCGKLYKSRVCFIKHIWEHTSYWTTFEGAKNHERVLSIQAAIILYCGMTGQTNSTASPDLFSLLVTSPHTSEAKNEKENMVSQSRELLHNLLFSSNEKFSEQEQGMNGENMKVSSETSCVTIPSNFVNNCKESYVSEHIIQALSSKIEKYCKESVIPDSLLWPPSSKIEKRSNEHVAGLMHPVPSLIIENYDSEVVNSDRLHQTMSSSSKDGSPQPLSHPLLLQSQISPSQTLQSCQASSPEKLFILVPSTSVQQLSPSTYKVYGGRNTRADTYGTSENNGASFVSPLKRKRED